MNMQGVASNSLVVACLILLTACSEPADEVNPVLIANDTVIQSFDRHFRSRTYWSEKVAQLQAQEVSNRQAFHKSRQEYEQLLREQRALKNKLMAENKAAGKDPNEGRKEAVIRYRDQLAKLRQENRQAAKNLHHDANLLAQAQRALYQNR